MHALFGDFHKVYNFLPPFINDLRGFLNLWVPSGQVKWKMVFSSKFSLQFALKYVSSRKRQIGNSKWGTANVPDQLEGRWETASRKRQMWNGKSIKWQIFPQQKSQTANVQTANKANWICIQRQMCTCKCTNSKWANSKCGQLQMFQRQMMTSKCKTADVKTADIASPILSPLETTSLFFFDTRKPISEV